MLRHTSVVIQNHCNSWVLAEEHLRAETTILAGSKNFITDLRKRLHICIKHMHTIPKRCLRGHWGLQGCCIHQKRGQQHGRSHSISILDTMLWTLNHPVCLRLCVCLPKFKQFFKANFWNGENNIQTILQSIFVWPWFFHENHEKCHGKSFREFATRYLLLKAICRPSRRPPPRWGAGQRVL